MVALATLSPVGVCNPDRNVWEVAGGLFVCLKQDLQDGIEQDVQDGALRAGVLSCASCFRKEGR